MIALAGILAAPAPWVAPTLAAPSQPTRSVSPIEAVKPVPAAKLEAEIASRITRVEEFRFLRDACRELKVRCWLFGGTASGYGHYVHWDLAREAGDRRYQGERFDYDYSNIFRSTQDADIVIDGTEEAAAELEKRLRKRFRHLQGSKDIWEVRLLEKQRGDKEALLNNKDFQNQHTDSNSTGMIEVTEPKKGEPVVRDLRDWKARDGLSSQFFKDLHERKLHYYHSPLHRTTARYKAGFNPEIFSVVRYLTKAFQYDLEMRPEDLAQVRAIIRAFRPERDLQTDYAQKWLEKNGKKLFQQAMNLEDAWNRIEKLGLRRKLLALGDPEARDTKDTLAWWMNREPLRSKPVGEGSGKTARELFAEKGWPLHDGLPVAAHETTSLLAYESITRAHTGAPNVLTSRQGSAGESAVHGEGFYTAAGRKGDKGTGMTIRFQINPEARLDTDFILADENYLIFQNKNALQVIPESLDLSPMDYFRWLTDEKLRDASDRALFEKLRRRMGVKMAQLGLEERERIFAMIRKEFARLTRQSQHLEARQLVAEALKFPELADSPEAEKFLALLFEKEHFSWAEGDYFFRHPGWNHLFQRESVLKALAKQGPDARVQVARLVLTLPAFTRRPDYVQLIERFMPTGPDGTRYARMLTATVFSDPTWAKRPEYGDFLVRMARQGVDFSEILTAMLTAGAYEHPRLMDFTREVRLSGEPLIGLLKEMRWMANPRAAELMDRIARGAAPPDLIEAAVRGFLAQPGRSKDPRAAKWLQSMIPWQTANQAIVETVLSRAEWAARPDAIDLLKPLLEIDDFVVSRELHRRVLTQKQWLRHPRLPELILWALELDPHQDGHLLLYPEFLAKGQWREWKEAESILERLMSDASRQELAIEHVFSRPDWAGHPRVEAFLDRMIEEGKHLDKILRHLYETPEWRKQPNSLQRLERILKRAPSMISQVADALRGEEYVDQRAAIQLIDELLKDHESLICARILSKPEWMRSPAGRRWLGKIAAGGRLDPELLNSVLSQPGAAAIPEARQALQQIVRRVAKAPPGERDWIRTMHIGNLLQSPEWAARPESADVLGWMLTHVDDDDWATAGKLRMAEWQANAGRERVLLGLLTRPASSWQPVTDALRLKSWADTKLGPVALVETAVKNPDSAKLLLRLKHWRENPTLLDWCHGRITLRCLKELDPAKVAAYRNAVVSELLPKGSRSCLRSRLGGLVATD